MANRCAGLDPTWTHLPAPAPAHTAHAAAGHCHSASSSWPLFPAAAFENEALTCALRASMSPANAASSLSYPTTPSSSPTSSASELLSGGHDAPAPASRKTVAPVRMGLKAEAGRVAKRKPRPSRRPPPTYIAADPVSFRRMVQEVTGFPVATPGVRVRDTSASEPASATAHSWSSTPSSACMLPTLDTSAFLLDRAASAPGANGKSSSGGESAAMAVAATEEDDGDDSSVFLELEAMACAPPAFLSDEFPTLESWGII